MRSKSVVYSSFLVYELIRLLYILAYDYGTLAGTQSRAWFAAVPLLVLVPVFFLMLALDESRFTLWLPLVALVKALSAISLGVYLVQSVIDYLAAGTIGSQIDALVISVFIILADAVLGVYCCGRNRILCT